MLARLFPAGGNFWRLLCNKPETGCGWIETERSPFFQGHGTHSLRNSRLSSNLWSDVLVVKWKRGKERERVISGPAGHCFPASAQSTYFKSLMSTKNLEITWILNMCLSLTSSHWSQTSFLSSPRHQVSLKQVLVQNSTNLQQTWPHFKSFFWNYSSSSCYLCLDSIPWYLLSQFVIA